MTGGTSALPGIRQLASQVLKMPVRTAGPDKLVGMTDQLKSPAYSTGVGLLHWAAVLAEEEPLQSRRRRSSRQEKPLSLDPVKDWFKRLLP